MASSRNIVAGENWTPDDQNNLRSDVLDGSTGHNHDGTDGRKVGFSDLDVSGALGSTAPSGGSTSYDDVDDHLQSSQGQHGLAADAYVLGTPIGSGYKMAWGYETHSYSGMYELYESKSISFNAGFTEPPECVQVTLLASNPTNFGVSVSNVSSSGCDVKTHRQAATNSQYSISGFYWLAIGK